MFKEVIKKWNKIIINKNNKLYGIYERKKLRIRCLLWQGKKVWYHRVGVMPF